MNYQRALAGLTLFAGALFVLWTGPSEAPPAAPSSEELRLRNDALARARVLGEGPFNASEVDFAADPNAGLIDPHLTTCTFLPTEPTGTTPKFDCTLENGKKIKVKYGWTREIPAEVAATRLLRGLGFAADDMSRVDAVRCYGCVISPFHVRSIARRLHLGEAFDRHLTYNHSIDFVNVVVERKIDGEDIEAGGEKGWAFYELAKIDPARGGATRAEVDALRLMAMFLAHWDNKASNQRLLCKDESTPCQHPVAMMQDLGSDFGPSKVNLKGWSKTPVWADAGSCTLSMKGLPYDGATFQGVRISEEGRRLLGDRLKQLSRAQIVALFTSAGFEEVDAWVAAFQDKVRQIEAPRACPTTKASS